MPSEWPRQITIIGQHARGETQTLVHALEKYRVPIRGLELSRFQREGLDNDGSDLVFLVLPDEPFSVGRPGPLEQRRASDTITRLWEILASEDRRLVHVAVPDSMLRLPDLRFSPLFTVALGLSGVAGVWEISTRLLDDDIVEMLQMRDLDVSRRHGRLLLYGVPGTQLYEFYVKITAEAWPTTEERDDGGEGPLDDLQIKYCFLAALALAGLEPGDLVVGVDAQSTNMSHYARHLSSLSTRTGLALAATTLTPTLRYLDRGWIERELKGSRKNKHQLPLAARLDGFPRDFPVIRAVPWHATAETLYSAITTLNFDRDFERDFERIRMSGNVCYTTVSIDWRLGR